MASASGPRAARDAAATLGPFWDRAVRNQTAEGRGGTTGVFGKALRAADAMADPATAAMLLCPFRVEDLTEVNVDSFGKITSGYGPQWTARLLRTWYGEDQPAWARGGGQERAKWIADRLPGLCAALHAAHSRDTVTAQRLLALSWEWLRGDIGAALASSPPSRRDQELSDLGKPLASALRAAAAIGAASTRDAMSGFTRAQGDAITTLEMSALRAVAERLKDSVLCNADVGDLAADCAARLRVRLARPQRAPGDWSVELPEGGCACDLCVTLSTFLAAPGRTIFEWPLAKQRRQHIHSRIAAAELPVTHMTRRQGSPYTLVLKKTDALFAREHEARARDHTDLEWLAAR
jgi:hypothetical protein